MGTRAREVASWQARLTSLSIPRIYTAADAPGRAISSLCNNRAQPGGQEAGGAGAGAHMALAASSEGKSLHALKAGAYRRGRQSSRVCPPSSA